MLNPRGAGYRMGIKMISWSAGDDVKCFDCIGSGKEFPLPPLSPTCGYSLASLLLSLHTEVFVLPFLSKPNKARVSERIKSIVQLKSGCLVCVFFFVMCSFCQSVIFSCSCMITAVKDSAGGGGEGGLQHVLKAS